MTITVGELAPRDEVDGEGLEGHRLTSRRYRLLLVALAVAVVVSFLMAVALGPVSVPVGTVWQIILHHLAGGPLGKSSSALISDEIVWQFRLPRAILGVFLGGGLALVGAVMQALVRNPLADPYLLGVSEGGALGAVIVLVIGSSALGGLSLSAAAFAGSVVALVMVYVIARRQGRVSPIRLILAGVAMAYFFQAAYSFVLQQSSRAEAANAVLFWLLGSLSGARWPTIWLPCAVVAAGLVVLLTQYRTLNALLAGEETAVSLGIDLRRVRFRLFVLTSLLVGVMVAAAGAIAFVGLVIPHVARLIVGADHRRLLPVTTLTGAAFLLLADQVARTAHQPDELSLSIVTAAVGVPFFVWLLRRQERSDKLSVS